MIIQPNSLYVISKSESIYNFHRSIPSQVSELSFANLNNDEDGIVVLDKNNRVIDSVKYSNEWGGNGGRSLERINLEYNSNNKNNWKSSLDLEGSTPGRINSVTPKNYDLTVKSIYPQPLFP